MSSLLGINCRFGVQTVCMYTLFRVDLGFLWELLNQLLQQVFSFVEAGIYPFLWILLSLLSVRS